jgi:HSP20 family molecular chaperone IbpA
MLRVSMVLRKEDVAMRSQTDFGRLLRSSVEFGWMVDNLPSAPRVELVGNHPPQDVEHTGEDACRVTLAVAGLRPDAPMLTT